MRDFAAIDFETANNERTSVCSVGVVIVRNGEFVDSFYSLIQPEPNYYNYWCTQVHGLTRNDTEEAPAFPEVWKQVEPLIEGSSASYHFRIVWLSFRESSSCPRRCRGLCLDSKGNPLVFNFSTLHYYFHNKRKDLIKK